MIEYTLRDSLRSHPGKSVWVDPATGDLFGSATPEQVSSWLKGGRAVEISAPRSERQTSWSVTRSARQELLWLLWGTAIACLLILLMLVFNIVP